MTPSREELERLRERVANASAADRDLDVALANLDSRKLADMPCAHCGTCLWPAYSASIDAALGLVGRSLPGRPFVIHGPDRHGRFWAGLGETLDASWEHSDVSGPSPPLAILAALLSALISRSEAPSVSQGEVAYGNGHK